MRHRGSFILISLAVSACVSSPAYHEPAVSVAPSYAVATAETNRSSGPAVRQSGAPAVTPRAPHYDTAVSDAPFWRELGDSVLVHLIEEALRSSTDVHSAEARLQQARATRQLAALDMTPSVTALGSASRSQLSIAQTPGLPRQLPRRDLFDLGFDASWEVDVFGRVRRHTSAQGAVVEATEHALGDVQKSLAAEVARTYFELRGAERQLAVARRNAENQQRTVALTEDRLSAGRGTAFDRERARSVLQLTLAGVPAIESRIAADRHRIGVLLGRSPQDYPKSLLQAGDLPTLPDSLRVGSPQSLVRRRPDVLAAERMLAARSLGVGVARADYLPRLSLNASAGYAATRFDSLARGGTSRVVIGPMLSWPLLDLARVRQRVDVARGMEDEARAQYSAAVLRAVEEAETALVSYDRAHARVGILKEAVTSSTRALELAQTRFEAGLTDFLQVLDAQRTLLEAESQLTQAHTAAATALVAVYKAVGGGKEITDR
jgi:outer membrane protein, multidrug efflux system